jgi:carbonic anhydrase
MALTHLFENNRKWSARIREQDPHFFESLAQQQSPRYLWIGCSDSRVPANEIIGLAPGEVFVHRNVANLVIHTDFNCLSVVQFAVEVLKVQDILVTGHYGCGGIRASLDKPQMGLIDNWLHIITLMIEKHKNRLGPPELLAHRLDLLCELNVIEQVRSLCTTTLIRNAWERGQQLSVHGCIYGLKDGLLHDLQINVSSFEELDAAYHDAIERLLTPTTTIIGEE